ncbi:MFS transporter [Caballeronia sp. INDeC2]|uniref:MFS transporter n=1 Tax=Caballeronia sp. INDeC2 TaxID=2921747 RepID=UPI002028C7A9|nr:MFS transporter [Caballeronia sp. INDeC2]
MLGTAIEWYDFFCYATAAALVFGDVFFAVGKPFLGTLASLATFAVGFVARPLGAVLFGHLGDRIGRKQALIVTLLVMGLSSTLIGLLPSYHTVGVLATVMLVLLRLVQGVAVGGEWGGAVLIAAEHAPPRWRTFLAAAPQYGSPIGLILATTMFQLMSRLPEADFRSWGWRVPFLVSALLVLIAFVIRRGVNESPELEAYRQKAAAAGKTAQTAPLKTIVRRFKGRLVLGIGLSMIGVAGFYFITTLMLTYTTAYLHVPKADVLRIINTFGFVELIVFPIGSLLAHRIGERRFIAAVSALTLLWAAPMMMLILTREVGNIAIAILVAAVFMSAYYAVLAPCLPKIFPVDVRYTGISLSYQICGAVFGGTTPLVGLWLAQTFGAHWAPLAAMFAAITGCTLVAALLLPADAREDDVGRNVRFNQPLSRHTGDTHKNNVAKESQ